MSLNLKKQIVLVTLGCLTIPFHTMAQTTKTAISKATATLNSNCEMSATVNF